jgi:membrane protein
MWYEKPLSLVKRAGQVWIDSNSQSMGGAIAYYTLFSIAPLLMITLGVAAMIYGDSAARGELAGQINSMIGSQAAGSLQEALRTTSQNQSSGLAIAVGAVVLLIGASGMFSEIQGDLNIIWGVVPKEGRGIRGIIRGRLLSFAMVFISCLVLLASLVAATVVAALGNYWRRVGMPDDSLAWETANTAISLLVVTTLFAMVYKYLPDAIIAWRDVMVGAGATAVLFALGRYLLGIYLSRTTIASAFGAAGSLAIVLVWIYYTSQIFLFGAAFTRVWAEEYGRGVRPLYGHREPSPIMTRPA